jgi:hypothetical protein
MKFNTLKEAQLHAHKLPDCAIVNYSVYELSQSYTISYMSSSFHVKDKNEVEEYEDVERGYNVFESCTIIPKWDNFTYKMHLLESTS